MSPKASARQVVDLAAETVTLTRTEAPWAGAEIEVHVDLTGELYQELDRWMAEAKRAGRNPHEQIAAIERVADLFVQNGLVSWNLERAGEAVPATVAGALSIPIPLLVALITLWLAKLAELREVPV